MQDIYGVSVTDNPGFGAWIMGEMRSDNTHYILNTGNRGFEGVEWLENFIDDYDNGYQRWKYFYNYILIGRANQVITKIEGVDLDTSVKDNLQGQALFLRALAYLDLVQYYGGVPLHLTPASSIEETALPRSTKEQVYEQIILDATEAASMLPNKSDQEPGRATSGAAKMLLANVYMVNEEWSKAETFVITSYSIHYTKLYDNIEAASVASSMICS